MGADGQIPSVTRSSFAVDTTIIYSASDYNSGIDFYLYALCIYAFLLLIATFGMEHSIWMPMYDFLQLVMALILINVNYPPDLLYSIFKVFASALTFLPNIFTSLFSQASYNATFINNNIYSVMQDSSFLRVMGHLYFILIILAVVLLVIFIFTKKSPSK
jgi:Na+-translocating ferredoxin:NAD+ oxidoreductase RnfA subunit